MFQDTYQPWWADPSIGMKDKWWENPPPGLEDMIAVAVADTHQQLEKFAYFPEDEPFEEEIEKPEEDILDIADHAPLPEVSASTLLEVGQNHDDEASKNLDMAQGQVEVVNLKVDDIQFNVNLSIVVGTNRVTNKNFEDVVVSTWSPLYQEHKSHDRSSKGFVHFVTTWVPTGKYTTKKGHRVKIHPFGGSMNLETPFDPGISGKQ